VVGRRKERGMGMGWRIKSSSDPTALLAMDLQRVLK